MGKKPGESFDLPVGDGSVETATVKEIKALSDDIRNWMASGEASMDA